MSKEEEEKSKKPSDSKFCQQRLPAWQPMLTARSAFPYFYVVGVIMIGLGILLLVTSNGVQEIVVEYTDCTSSGSTDKCSSIIKKNLSDPANCTCTVTFELTQDFSGQVYLYYGLTNFYQNHRFYARSRDDSQLYGADVSSSSLDSNCKPFRTVGDTSTIYAPCGAIANSLFNDSFTLSINANNIGMTSSGIAWETDRTKKYGTPSSWNNTVKPPSWRLTAQQRNGYAGDEELMVWMRSAALPTFRKLHRILTNSSGLAKGNYTMKIDYHYPVVEFGGTKFFVLSTISWMGGRNPRLGIAYLVVGGIHILLGIAFTFIHLKMRTKSSPHAPAYE